MKKTTLLILFVCALTLFLAACGKTPTDTTTSSSTSSSTTSESCTHAFSDWVVLKDPSCTEDGMRVQSCIYCQMGKFEPIAMTGHTEVIDQAIAPTCTKTGLTEGKRCSACNTVLVMQDLVSANGHTDTNNDNFCEVCNDPVIACSQGLAYTLSDDGTHYILSGIGACTDTEIVIPSTYNSLPVKAIGDYAFAECASLTSVMIPNSVTSIGDYACAYCTSLTKIIIPNSVATISIGAFGFCENLTSVTIPNSITSISDETFALCKRLTSITIPNSVTSIGESAFSRCTSLASITIPSSVTSIGCDAFAYCESLTNIAISEGVTSIGSSAFYHCESLADIAVEEGNTAYKSIDGNLYTKDGKTLIQYAIGKANANFEIPYGVASIGNHAFFHCESLTSITIPNSVTSIGSAFGHCSALTSVTIPDSVTTIGGGAFFECIALDSVTIGNSITSIGDGAFYGCTKLASITIPNSVKSIGCDAFYRCKNLTSATFENPNGWWYAASEDATSGTSLSTQDLADPAKATEYLCDTYFIYYWFCD